MEFIRLNYFSGLEYYNTEYCLTVAWQTFFFAF